MVATTERLITLVGGSGFIGTYVARSLAKKGYRLRILCRDPQGALALKVLGDPGQVALEYLDLAESEVAGRLSGSYAVVNLVGILFERGGQRFDALHAEGAAKLAAEAAQAGVQRFVQISALGSDKSSGSSYARTKQRGEQAVLAAFPNATILRPSVVFGREDKFFNRFAALARSPMERSGFLPLIGGGKTRYQPVYVEDVARAVLASIERDDAKGRTYELGGPETLSLREIYDFIARTTDRNIHYVPMPFCAAGLLGTFGALLPTPPITRDQVELMKTDNIVDAGADGFAALGIVPTAMEAIVPEYLDRFRFRRYQAA